MTGEPVPHQAPLQALPSAFRDEEPFALTAQGQALTFFPAGKDRLQALLTLIHGAQQNLRLCFYIFLEDEAGVQVRDALIAAADRGVDTRLIVDGFGAAADEDSPFFAAFRAAGGQYHVFTPRFGRRYLIRNHQKMAIADGERAMIGGFNIENAYFEPPESNGWRDLGIWLEGSAVGELLRWYGALENWLANPRQQLLAIRRQVRRWDGGSGPVRLLIGGPTEGLSGWARHVGQDLRTGSRLDMVMAYFSPSAGLLRRIARIGRSGQARLVLAGKSDNAATIGATRSLYTYLLKRKVQIWEFSPCKLHTKLIVIDDVTYIGSANFDMRSLFLNLELMLRIEDAALAERMRAFVSGHLPYSEEILLPEHRRRATVWNRLRWGLSWFLVTVVDYTVSRRLNLGL
ncbi:MAG: phospholipase D-like domain-containing protein [Sphingomonadaceae bacterium]